MNFIKFKGDPSKECSSSQIGSAFDYRHCVGPRFGQKWTISHCYIHDSTEIVHLSDIFKFYLTISYVQRLLNASLMHDENKKD